MRECIILTKWLLHPVHARPEQWDGNGVFAARWRP